MRCQNIDLPFHFLFECQLARVTVVLLCEYGAMDS